MAEDEILTAPPPPIMLGPVESPTSPARARHRRRPPSRLQLALSDLREGAGRHWLWRALAFQDLRIRYRGSMLGPFWITLSMAIMITAMGMVYRHFFNMELHAYLPFLALGLILWNQITAIVTEGCATFVGVAHEINQIRLPYSIQAYRAVLRNALVLGHHAVLVPMIFVIFGIVPGWIALSAVPGLLLIAFNAFWVSLFLGVVSARFRDVPPIVASMMQVVFFMTPIFWVPSAVGKYGKLVQINPFFAFIDIVRAPLLGAAPAATSWPIALGSTLAVTIATLLLFTRFRGRIAFWV